MKKMINIRNSVIIILCITIICISIGFIIVAVNLKHEKDKVDVFDVNFVGVDLYSSLKGGSKEPIGDVSINENKKELDMNFTLNVPHDGLVYTATIKNEGNIPCEIVDLVESPDYSKDRFSDLISPVSIKVSDIDGKVLEPNEELEVKIDVYYNPSTKSVVSKNIDYKLSLITKSK